MTQEEIKQYLKDNLKLGYFKYRSCGQNYIGFKLTLGEEIISEIRPSIKSFF